MASEKATQIPLSAHSLFNSKTDERITRLSKVLSTTSGIDATLTLVGYGLFFVSSQIPKLEKLELKASTLPGISKHGAASIVKLAELEASGKTLAAICSDVTMFTRLWGLLGTYAMVKRNYLHPPQDALLRAVAYGQTLSLGAYYVYENGFYLAKKGVIRGWAPEKIIRTAKISFKMFLVYVLFDFIRLYRVRQLREVRKAKAVDEKGKVAIAKEEEIWWRGSLISAAYAPLSIHWSSETGLLSDALVGALMSAVGLVKFRAAWAQTA